MCSAARICCAARILLGGGYALLFSRMLSPEEVAWSANDLTQSNLEVAKIYYSAELFLYEERQFVH